MKTSIATVSISGDLREKLAATAAAGFDGVELFENDFLAFDGTPAEVGRMVRRADHPNIGLILDSFHTCAVPHRGTEAHHTAKGHAPKLIRAKDSTP